MKGTRSPSGVWMRYVETWESDHGKRADKALPLDHPPMPESNPQLLMWACRFDTGFPLVSSRHHHEWSKIKRNKKRLNDIPDRNGVPFRHHPNWNILTFTLDDGAWELISDRCLHPSARAKWRCYQFDAPWTWVFWAGRIPPSSASLSWNWSKPSVQNPHQSRICFCHTTGSLCPGQQLPIRLWHHQHHCELHCVN